ncbi:site-specific integrase [Ochrobactrum sp. GPK 3]|uniref:tyrosine-type recombinase/integrase n=1 Tax=Brucella sp. 22210 TaxID=3453892 RepID=UPI0031385454
MTSLLVNDKGYRKYLTQEERERFLGQSRKAKLEVYIFCRIMMETGCRISEALNLRREHIDLVQKCVYIETLKQRKKGAFRHVPISNVSLMELMSLHEMRQRFKEGYQDQLWDWSRMTAYRHIVSVMTQAGIAGPHASPKGLRHGFAVAALQAGVPMNLVQRWLGHSHWNTTAIYAEVIDAEERRFAELVWFGFRKEQSTTTVSPHHLATKKVSLASQFLAN